MESQVMIQPRYAETDQMGVVYHGNYFTYYEVGRTQFFADAGYSYRKLEEEGVILPVLSCESKFKKPVKYGEPIIVKTTIDFIKRIRIGFLYKIYRKSDGVLLAEGKSTHAFVNKELKPIKRSELNEAFQKILKTIE